MSLVESSPASDALDAGELALTGTVLMLFADELAQWTTTLFNI